MSEETLERSRFAVVMRGYDRDQVNAILEACERWAREAQAHMDESEAKLAETDRRAEALEARLSELEARAGAPQPRSLQMLAERVEQMLGVALETADELQEAVVAEARTEREQTQRDAQQLRQAAKKKAAEITAAARRRREETAPAAHETRRESEQHVEEGRAAAAERSRLVWERAEGPMREVRRELAHLEDQRRLALEELSGLQRSLDDLVAVS